MSQKIPLYKLIILLLVTAAASLATPALLNYNSSEIQLPNEDAQKLFAQQHKMVGELVAIWQEFDAINETAPNPAAQVNILLLGLDHRGLSDALIILSYNTETFDSAMIALKRDTYVSFQQWAEKGRGYSALGWANYVGTVYGGDDYLEGAAYAARTIEQLLGIDIHFYASINFEGFVNLIDLIGGVTVNVPRGFAERSGDKLRTGWRHLSGEEALIFARHRSNPRIPEPGSISEDGDRVRRNQRLLQAVIEQCTELTTEELMEIFEQIDQNLYTNMQEWDLAVMATLLYTKDPRDIELVVLPGELRTVHEELIEMDIEYYFLDEVESDKILKRLGLKY